MLRKTITRLACLPLAAVLAACGSAPVAPGYYRVEQGDTVTKIARVHRQSVQSIVRWNNLPNPDSIEVGQTLRVVPPGTTPAAGGPARTGNAPVTAATAPGEAPARTPAASTAPTSAPATGIALIWPTQGTVVRTFNGANSKGIDIANAAGTPVVAAAPGTIVYAGNGLRGYGNLLIVKHNADFLTAYAHNRALLVKEGDRVTQGQKIAEMGDTDNDRVALHFELRYGGSSIDPSRYLPTR
ncbi:peptidoglycan DD-metalloendopeptidase family protein [Trinickia fusca]|uniref:LysM peptidoglycan-binding domain-containing protein n=1 Tax=Trinickia fusca TaxID=2419777 RepID=A0A494XNM2_9BURK|nr:peptidoglycan DD-metalloendopeptidase family protein [Trinickia fusca]RKP52228.1 LysM peptidoglycan-binding domain-containing protein [Trinickia fusca]